MLEIMDLHKSYGRFVALNGLSLKVDDSSIFGFVGPNGAGKTTTLKIIAGLLSANFGQVVIGGVDVTKEPRKLREKIGYMPDFFGVYDNLKVSEYLDFYAGTYYIPYSERSAMIDNLLELVDLVEKRESYVDSLSRGMKQRLCLARSLVHDPEILILDEPASGLDPRARIEMKEVLKQLRTLGKTVIISSHILPELAELCDTVGIINRGRLTAQGTVNEIMQSLSGRRRVYIKVLENLDKLVEALKEIPEVSGVEERVEDLDFSFDGDDRALAELIRQLVHRGLPIVAFKEKEGNLEDIFMQLTGDPSGIPSGVNSTKGGGKNA